MTGSKLPRDYHQRRGNHDGKGKLRSNTRHAPSTTSWQSCEMAIDSNEETAMRHSIAAAALA